MNKYFGNGYRNSPPFSLRPIPPCGTSPLSPVNTSNPPGGGRPSENNSSKIVKIGKHRMFLNDISSYCMYSNGSQATLAISLFGKNEDIRIVETEERIKETVKKLDELLKVEIVL